MGSPDEGKGRQSRPEAEAGAVTGLGGTSHGSVWSFSSIFIRDFACLAIRLFPPPNLAMYCLSFPSRIDRLAMDDFWLARCSALTLRKVS